MPKLLKKFIFSFLTFALLFQTLAAYSPARAQSEWYAPGPIQFYKKAYQGPEDEIFGERYTSAQVSWIFWSVMWFPMNVILGPKLGSCIIDAVPTSVRDAYQSLFSLTVFGDLSTCILPAWQRVESFFIGYKSEDSPKTLFASVFADREISFVSYLSKTLNKFGDFHLIPEANAQGFGYQALSTVQDLWQVSRDISYGLLIVIIIAMAFMIMFRVKLNPQTVISVQSALPKIVAALILITFSYAIAGFLIDLMYVVYGLLSLLIAPLFHSTSSFEATPANIFNFLTGSLKSGGILAQMLVDMLIPLLIIGIICFVGAILLSETIIGSLIFLAIFIAALVVVPFLILRIVWMLLKAFATVLLLTIAAPIYILIGTIVPSFSFGSWVQKFVANLGTFVTTSVLFIFAEVFFYSAWNGLGISVFENPLITLNSAATIGSGTWPPILGGGGQMMTSVLMAGVGLVLMSLTAKASDIIASIMSGKPFAYGSGIGQALGPGILIGSQIGEYKEAPYRAAQEGAIKKFQQKGDYGGAAKIQAKVQRRDIAKNLFGQLTKGK